MTGSVTGLWRHPIKGHGREQLDKVTLSAGQTMPGDRVWAVAHEKSSADGSEWVPSAHFSRGSKAPGLMAIESALDEVSGRVSLSHPDLIPITLDPDREPEKLIAWTRPIMPEDRAGSARVIRVNGRGMTDTDFPSISIGNVATHRVITDKLGRDLSEKRWRINIWLDGLAPWEEFNWIGHEIEIGGVRLKIEEPITRCMATTANPDTGIRDADTLGALESWGHQDMGVYGMVTTGGDVAIGDGFRVL